MVYRKKKVISGGVREGKQPAHSPESLPDVSIDSDVEMSDEEDTRMAIHESLNEKPPVDVSSPGSSSSPSDEPDSTGPIIQSRDLEGLRTPGYSKQKSLLNLPGPRASHVRHLASNLIQIINNTLPDYILSLGIRAIDVQRNENLLVVILSGSIGELKNMHITFVHYKQNNSPNIHVTANIPINWVQTGLNNNPRIHVYYNRSINIISDNGGNTRQPITNRNGVDTDNKPIKINNLVNGLSRGPNKETAKLLNIPVEQLQAVFGRANEGRLPFGGMSEEELRQMLNIMLNLTNYGTRIERILELVAELFNKTTRSGSLQGGNVKTRKRGRKEKKQKTKGKRSKSKKSKAKKSKSKKSRRFNRKTRKQ